jgi:threonine dehydratase
VATQRQDPALEPESIRAALARIPPVFRDSPQYVHEGLSARAGRPVIVKIESVNPIGAFKGRGCWRAIEALAGEGRIAGDRPVVVASTGNFGQGVAYAARAQRIPAVVFADEHANPTKLDRMRRFGATVIQAGHDFDAAREAAARYAAEHDSFLLVDGEEPWVAAGAGTLAVELTDGIERGELPALASAWIPVGNGALIVGVGAWLRHAAPGCRVTGVQSEAAPSMTLSWRANAVVETPTAATFADGIASRVPVPEALDMMVGRVDDMVLISEEAIRAAQAELTVALGITVEGAAAASWAGLLAAADDAPDGAAFVLVTGSNARAATEETAPHEPVR